MFLFVLAKGFSIKKAKEDDGDEDADEEKDDNDATMR